MIGSQATFLPHVYKNLLDFSSRWGVSSWESWWMLQVLQLNQFKDIQWPSSNLQAGSKKRLVKLLLDGWTVIIYRWASNNLTISRVPEISCFGMVPGAFQPTRCSSKRSTHTPCMLRLAKILIILSRLKTTHPIVTRGATPTWPIPEQLKLGMEGRSKRNAVTQHCRKLYRMIESEMPWQHRNMWNILSYIIYRTNE